MRLRRRRNREIPVELEPKIQAAFQDDIAQGFLTLHPVEDEQVTGAVHLVTLLAEHPLRTLDAIHLGIARRIGADIIATADAVMANAEALGLDASISVERDRQIRRKRIRVAGWSGGGNIGRYSMFRREVDYDYCNLWSKTHLPTSQGSLSWILDC